MFSRRSTRRPPLSVRLLAALMPPAERAELIDEVEAERERRVVRDGAVRATVWLWSQALGSLPALIARSWSRGLTGFDAHANAMNPGGPAMERWMHDIRHAVRRLRRRPAFTALAAGTLAIGVGGIAAIGGIVRPLLIDPLPYPHADQLAQFWQATDWRGVEVTALRPEWAADGFSGVVAYRAGDVTLERDGEPARLVPGISATTELFSVLGVQPLIGRGFVKGEDAPTAAPVVVLSHALWKTLGGDETLVGKTLKLDGKSRTVIGVMPPGFWFPDPTVGVWAADSLAPDGGVGFYTLVGRVAPGQRVDHMQPGLDRVTKLLGSRFTYARQFDRSKNASLTPIVDAMVGPMRPMLYATAAGMVVILLIACANVAALVLGQVESRSTELSVRAALGANRARIAAHVVLELLALGVLGGAAGSFVATLGFRVLRASLALGAWRERATLDWTVFTAAFVVALVCSLAIALLPVLSLMRRDIIISLAGTRTSGVLGRGGLQSPMIVAEVALAVLLTCAAGLVVRSVAHLYAVRPGLDTRAVAVIDVAMPNGTSNADRTRMMADVLRELSAITGVRSVAATQRLPLRGRGWTMGLRLPDASPDAPTPNFRMVSRDYFKTLGIPLVRGRTFAAADAGTDSISSIVVNQTLARLYFSNVDPIGQIMLGGFGKPERIIGVVGDVAETTLKDAMPPARYYLADQVSFVPGAQTIVARLEREPDAARVLAESRRVIAQTAPVVAVQDATTMSRVVDLAVGPARDMMSLLTLLTLLALALGAVGIYGVISQFVSRRRREWSIRIALGLSPRRLVAVIVSRGLGLAAMGVVAGVAGAIGLARFLSTFLYGVTAHDPVSVAGAALLLLVVGAAAALVPALRAGRVDPALALREE